MGVDETHGTIQYSTDNGTTWTNVGSVSNSNALLLPADADTRVRLVPTDTYLGTISDAITFRAWDQTSGTDDTYADTTTSGGDTAFSTATDTVAMTIDPVVGGQSQIENAYPIGSGVDSQGNSFVAWFDQNTLAVMGQSYAPGGTPIGGPLTVSPTGTHPAMDSAALNTQGTAVYTWGILSNGLYELYALRFQGGTATALDAQPVLLFSSASEPTNLMVEMDGNDAGFVMTYDITGDDGTTQAFVRQFSASGQDSGPIALASAPGDSQNLVPWVGVAADGSFVAAWQSFDGTNYQTQALRFTASGQLRDGADATPIQVLPPQTTNPGGLAEVAAAPDGSFAVAWNVNVDPATSQSYVRHFDAQLNASRAIPVGPAGAGQLMPGVVMDAQGDFGVVASDGTNTWGQFFTPNNQPESDAFPISTGATGLGAFSSVELFGNGAGGYESAWGSADGNNTIAQPLQLNEAPTATTIPIVTVTQGAAPTTIDLSQYFTDADIPYRDQLTYSITGNTNTSLVTTSISGSTLSPLRLIARVVAR